MRINNNMMAMNTHRQLGIANTGGAKSMEKLSSGFRINRAGDDAAGLAISEKMRGQIRGLNQASTNSQDAISLIQTTEGALNETHAILQRMRELAVQSATDTNTDADRSNLQDEIDQLTGEITRISTTTQFNTMNLLDGTFEGKRFHIGANEGQDITFDVNDMGADALKLMENGSKVEGIKVGTENNEFTLVNRDGDNTGKLSFVKAEDINADKIKELGLKAGDTVDAKVEVDKDGNVTVTQGFTVKDDGKTAENAVDITYGDVFKELEKHGIKVESDKLAEISEENVDEKFAGTFAKDTSDKVEDKYAINISKQKPASEAITTINDALETVSKERSKLGAIQNRLEHTIKNLDTSAENLQASESRIRDVDMAKEMMEQTKQNILQQASTAMLAQANMAPQTVLQLLG